MSDNRAKLLQIALELFAAHGYDAVGIQQIVTLAEVTKPTLYHYFKSKKGLFEAILDEKSEHLLIELRHACQYQGDITQSITQITMVYFDFFKENNAFYRLLLVHWFTPPSNEVFPAISHLQAQQSAYIEQLFLDAVVNHGNMRGRHKQYAISLRGMIDTYIGLSLQGYLQLGQRSIVDRIVHQFMHGIFS